MAPVYWKSLVISVEPSKASAIQNVCDDMVRLAQFLGHEVKFTFNGFRLTAGPDSKPEDLLQAYAAEKF